MRDREPLTRGGKPNMTRELFERDLAKVITANDAIAEMLGVPANFNDRNT